MSGASDSIHVLHVDDEPGLTDMVATFLEREDDRITVRTATSASDGRDVLAEWDVDCIISDYDMPEQNGIEFLTTVRDDHPDLPFILHTGKGSEEVAADAISAGVTDYLQKERGTDQYTILANRVVNVVERYRAERDAEQTRTQLQAISENSTDAIVIIDADSRIRFSNPAVEDHFGYPPSELRGQRLTTLMPQQHREQHLAAIDQYLETGERTVDWTNIEFPGLHRDGTVVPLSLSFGEFRQDGARRFIGIMRNISERTRMGAELREREERFRLLAENIEEVVWMSTPGKEEVLYVNPAYEDIWGQSTDALYDDPTAFLEAIHPADRDRVEAALDSQMGGEYDEEYRIIRPDGELRWVRDRAVPVENDEGEVYRMVGIASDITERKEQTRQLETLISNLPGLVYRCRNEPAWPMKLVRGACEELTGYSAEELERDEVIWGEEVIHPEDQDRIWMEVQESVENDQPFETTYRIQTNDGTTRWVWERGRLVTPGYDDETLLEGFITDITNRKVREQQLRRIERRYQAIFNDPNILVGLLDTDGSVLDINQTAMDYVELPRGEIVDTPFWETPWFSHSEELRAEVKGWVTRAVGGEYVEFEADLEHPNGEPYTVEGVFRPVTNDDGEVVSLLVSDRDITEQRQRERELEGTNRLLSTLFETLPVGVTILDTEGAIVRANRRAEDVLGLTKSDIIGRTYSDPEWEIFDEHGDPVPPGDLPFARVLETGEPIYGAEHGIEWPDGGDRWLSINATPITTDSGELEQVVATITDTTDSREYERAIEAQNERLEEFASIVSHDLRNPLTVAEGQLALGRDECDNDHLEAVARAHERMNGLIDDLLTLARDGDDAAVLEPVPLADCSEACWQTVETAAATLVVDTDRTLTADRSRLQRLLENLYRNAVEHGGEDVTVTVGEVDDGFYVEDDGPGIPERDRTDVFDAGYSTSDEGTGFGLSIVERVCDAHGWEIRVTDGSEGGARFEITGVAFAGD